MGALPDLLLNPDVDVPVYCYASPGEAGADLVGRYEAGAVQVLAGPCLPLTGDDLKLLAGVNPPPTGDNALKKARVQDLLLPDSRACLWLCGGRRADAGRLAGLVGRATEAARRLARAWFPRYRFVGEHITWRLTPTAGEEMHYDSYNGKEDGLHRVRLFFNLDAGARRWRIGPSIGWAIRALGGRLREHLGLHPNRLNSVVNELLPWGDVPRHAASFAAHNCWLVDSQQVAHEIVCGRKMLACTFEVDAASMHDPAGGFAAAVGRAVAGLRAG